MECCEDSDINFYRLVTACLHFLYSCESKKMAVQECIEQAEGKCVVFVRFHVLLIYSHKKLQKVISLFLVNI